MVDDHLMLVDVSRRHLQLERTLNLAVMMSLLRQQYDLVELEELKYGIFTSDPIALGLFHCPGVPGLTATSLWLGMVRALCGSCFSTKLPKPAGNIAFITFIPYSNVYLDSRI